MMVIVFAILYEDRFWLYQHIFSDVKLQLRAFRVLYWYPFIAQDDSQISKRMQYTLPIYVLPKIKRTKNQTVCTTKSQLPGRSFATGLSARWRGARRKDAWLLSRLQSVPSSSRRRRSPLRSAGRQLGWPFSANSPSLLPAPIKKTSRNVPS